MRKAFHLAAYAAVAISTFVLLGGIGVDSARGADHGDAPNVAGDQNADLGDTYVFLDPNDNTKLILATTFRGFIVPGEANNFVIFDPTTTYRFEIEQTGDTRADMTIDVNFSAKGAAAAEPQTATVTLSGRPRRSFTAPTTVATLAAAPLEPTITTDPGTGIAFFAGEVDDPFFFDIPGFARFTASVRAGSPDPTQLARGRDTFSGYNILTFAMSIPLDLVRGAASNNSIGVNTVALRKGQRLDRNGVLKGSGRGKQYDRAATPGVNAVLIPFGRKNEHNVATPRDDADGRFASDLVATLTTLGANEQSINTLAGVVVTNGDYQRIDLSIPNTGAGGGSNPEAAFPNGRRLQDDVIDTILTIIANGTDLGDSVDTNDLAFRDAFPFFAPPHQPRAAGVVDDNTRN
jgi:hypothetical protein